MSRRIFPPLFLVCCLLGVTLPPSLAHGQTCRTRCAAREVIDLDGCCVPLDLEPPMVTLPDTSTLKVELDWSSNPQAHHFSAMTPGLPPEGFPLPAPTPDPALRRERSWAAWGALLAMDDHIRQRGKVCQSLEHSPPKRRACVASFRAQRDARQRFLERAVPLWTSHLARLEPGEIERVKAAYYLGTGLILLRFHKEGVKQLQQVVEEAPESPYATFALATMGDFFYSQGSPKLAIPLLLRASQQGPAALRAYALHMVGWCMAMEGDVPRALEAMLKAWQVARAPRMYLGEELREGLLRDMTELYAQVGAGARAAEFYRQLGLPGIAQSLWLERLERRYLELGKRDAAQAIYPDRARPPQAPGNP